MAEETPRRGRPRSAAAIARDNAILKLLRGKQALTRNQIAQKLNIPRGLVYLSLDRLHHEGKIEKIENDSRFAWRKAPGQQ